jgi:uncharacterized protein YxjI
MLKNLQSYQQYNEEISKRGLLGAAAVVGGLAIGGGVAADKMNAPKTGIEQSQHTIADIPSSFKMKQKLITVGTDMFITDDNRNNYGRVEERSLNLSSTFEYIDPSGKVTATAKQKILSLWTEIEVTDEHGQKIGSVEEEVIESIISVAYSIYSIKDANGNLIAKSKKLDLLTTNVDLKTPSGQTIATLHKKLISIGGVWDVNIKADVDKRLIVFIAPFIQSSQDAKSSNSDSSSN